MICGLTAKTTASGPGWSASSSAVRQKATAGFPENAAGRPVGSITTNCAAAPPASQPRSIAEPIWPQPTRIRRSAFAAAAPFTGARSGLADRVDHRRRHRFFRRFAAPDHQLEGRIEALAFGEGDIDEILDLLGAGGADATQQYRITKGRRGLAGGKIEMAEPHLFVGQRQQLVKRAAAALRHTHIEAAGEMQRAQLLLPQEIKPVVAPAAADLDDQLLFAGAVVRPVVGDDDFFDEIDRITAMRAGFDQ